MLFFMPQSTAMMRFGPRLYKIGFLIETSATRLERFGSSNSSSVVATASLAAGFWAVPGTILPSIVPCERRSWVSARVSIPVIAGILCFLSQSARL